MNKPKLLFVYDLENPTRWKDGLWAALVMLEKDFSITYCNLRKDTEMITDPDFVLGWGGFKSSVDIAIQNHKGKKGLCIGGNAFPPDGANNYDVLFYETKWYRPQIAFHKNIVHAFGVNTDIYNEITLSVPILWDYIGVGSFSKWKRWEKMIQKPGNRLILGEYQRNNEAESLEIVKELVKGNVMVSDQVNPFDLSMYLHSARTLYIPADIYGGGERAILEARACGLSVEIEDDNPKLKELLDCPIYDYNYYSSQLKKGIMSVL